MQRYRAIKEHGVVGDQCCYVEMVPVFLCSRDVCHVNELYCDTLLNTLSLIPYPVKSFNFMGMKFCGLMMMDMFMDT